MRNIDETVLLCAVKKEKKKRYNKIRFTENYIF